MNLAEHASLGGYEQPAEDHGEVLEVMHASGYESLDHARLTHDRRKSCDVEIRLRRESGRAEVPVIVSVVRRQDTCANQTLCIGEGPGQAVDVGHGLQIGNH
jgi:hypothetical protein